jgi:aspartate kinase
MMRNTAISFSVAVPSDQKKIAVFIEDLSDKYNILKDDGLELITIRHYDEATELRMKEGKIVLFEETIHKTVRMVVKDIPKVVRK